MTYTSSPDEIRKILEEDRVWSAYALADLDPDFRHLCDWFMEDNAVVMIYRGIKPPVLFATGQPQSLRILLTQVAPGNYLYTLPGYVRAILRRRMRIKKEVRMWRMSLKKNQFLEWPCQEVGRLGVNDLDKIAALFDDHPDRPDAFTPEQLNLGIFYGAEEGEELISISGTHIVSEWASVAAIGNVFTRPDHRGKGWATRVSAAVISALLAQGINTIVLNVDMENQPGLACYRKLGFWPHYGYYEGVMEIWPEQHNPIWRVQ